MATIVLEDTHHSIPDTGVVYYPAIDTAGDECCIAWTAYVPGYEILWARAGDKVHEVYRSKAISPPAVAGRGDGSWEVVAAVHEKGSWSIKRFLISDSSIHSLPSPDIGDVTAPEGVRVTWDPISAKSYLAVSVFRDGSRSVVVYSCSDSETALLFQSPNDTAGNRPSICIHKGNATVVYDGWDGSSYQIYKQDMDRMVMVSDGDGWNINADVAVDGRGVIAVCWVHTRDVVSSDGVVDAHNAIRVRYPSKNDPPADLEDLSHGLLETDPNPGGVWGYLGRRRHPMLLDTPSGLKLLWEQKADQNGATRKNTGILWSRNLQSATDTAPSALLRGSLWYEVPGSKKVRTERFQVACFEGVYTDDRTILVKKIELKATSPAAQRLPPESWKGWQPVSLPDKEMTTFKRPTIDSADGPLSLYWFDLHCHSVMSADAEGELDECVATGRYKAKLDGLLITDNDHYVVPLNHYEWRRSHETMDELNSDSKFVALTGYEWTSRPIVDNVQIIDHRSVLLPDGTEDIVRWNEVGGDIETLYKFVDTQGGVVHAHHQDWRLTGHPVEANIEACSSWNPYLEVDPGPFHRELQKGRKVGVIGGSDEHRRNPGLGGSLTGIWARSLTREHVIAALRAHRCYATMGRRLVLDFKIDGRFMGSTITGKIPGSPLEVYVDAFSSVPILSIELILDGNVEKRFDVGDLSARITSNLIVEPANHFVYLKLILEGEAHRDYPSNIQPLKGARAWSSPIWIEG